MNSKVLRNLSYGMYIVGAKGEKNVGCVVNTVVQITSNPSTIAVSINHDNYTNQVIKKEKKFSISILPENIDPRIIGTFGYQSSKDVDKYADVETVLLDEFPVIKGSCGAMICEVVDTLETSTHTVFLAQVINMDFYNEMSPMTYRYYHQNLKGKSPKNAPTYVEESPKKKVVWKCKVCGYEVEMDELPDDFRCPICGKDKSFFERIEK